ncbi:hypothetical protein NMY22_g5541 [Coprinellus aureogranulatus]|nr:hypothetical protein NMY22_g5541 [Coprinellus aureogranulatus]
MCRSNWALLEGDAREIAALGWMDAYGKMDKHDHTEENRHSMPGNWLIPNLEHQHSYLNALSSSVMNNASGISTSRATRPRAKSPKTEALLKGVERRSIIDLRRLATPSCWATTVEDGAIALRLVFGMLDEETMPREAGTPDSEAMILRMKFARHCMEAVMTSVGQIMSKAQKKAKEVYSPIYQEYLDVYIRWAGYLARETAWLYTDYGPRAALFGANFAAESLERMYGAGTDELRSDMRGNFRLMKLMITLWTWRRGGRGSPAHIQYASETQICALLSLFGYFTNDTTSMRLLYEAMEEAPPSVHRAFVGCSLSRLEEWKTCRLKPNITGPPAKEAVIIIEITQEFLEIHSFAKAYVKSKFSSIAYSLLESFSNVSLSLPDNSGPYPLSVVAATRLFFPDPAARPPYLVLHTVPQLLDAGLIRTIVNDMLRQPPGIPNPFHVWGTRGRDGPLDALIMLAVQRPICEAIARAIRSISNPDIARLQSGWLSEKWTNFSVTFRGYEYALREALELPLLICDNPKHHSRPRPKGGRSRECGQCGVVAYCSVACQREDWNSFHNEECSQNRAYRMERELAYAWPSHQTRLFYVVLLQHFILNYEIGMRPESPFAQHRRINATTLVNTTPTRLQSNGFPIADRLGSRIIQFNTVFCPPMTAHHTVQETMQVRFAGRYLYDDPRWRYLFQDMNESASRYGGGASAVKYRVRLATIMVFVGTWRVFTTGRFVVGKDWDSGRVSVELLNGYVKVEKRDDWEGPDPDTVSIASLAQSPYPNF